MNAFVRTFLSVWSRLLLNVSFRRNPPPALDNDSPLSLGFRGSFLDIEVLERFFIELFVCVKHTPLPGPLTTAPSTVFLPRVSSPNFSAVDVRVRLLAHSEMTNPSPICFSFASFSEALKRAVQSLARPPCVGVRGDFSSPNASNRRRRQRCFYHSVLQQHFPFCAISSKPWNSHFHHCFLPENTKATSFLHPF